MHPRDKPKMEQLIHEQLNSPDPQVLIQAKFIEIEQNDLNDLSFNYNLSRTLDAADTGRASGKLEFDRNDNVTRSISNNSVFSFINVTADCDDCGICVDVCPKNAVDESNGYSTIDKNCIFCCACIKACPQQARILKDGPIKDKAKWLSENCAHRKEPQTYLSGA